MVLRAWSRVYRVLPAFSRLALSGHLGLAIRKIVVLPTPRIDGDHHECVLGYARDHPIRPTKLRNRKAPPPTATNPPRERQEQVVWTGIIHARGRTRGMSRFDAARRGIMMSSLVGRCSCPSALHVSGTPQKKREHTSRAWWRAAALEERVVARRASSQLHIRVISADPECPLSVRTVARLQAVAADGPSQTTDQTRFQSTCAVDLG